MFLFKVILHQLGRELHNKLRWIRRQRLNTKECNLQDLKDFTSRGNRTEQGECGIVLNTIDISFHPTEPQQLKLIYFHGDKDSACLFRESNLGTLRHWGTWTAIEKQKGEFNFTRQLMLFIKSRIRSKMDCERVF